MLVKCLSSVSNLLVRIACVIVEEQRTLLFRLLLATAVAIKAAIVHPNMPAYLSTRLRDLRMSLTDRIGEVDANYGTALVVEYVNPVVQFLSNSVKASEKKFDMTDLELLYRLSGYSLDEAFARDIICTVLSRLEKKLPKESTLNKLLNVVASLMGKVGDPSEFIK
uniref:TIP120 domain-containing protein n=1 Tax=Angiostrongylus cantonensis TaxID=6313 RepID=A0A158PBP3_ANGCA